MAASERAWVERESAAIAADFESDLERIVAISSPFGDRDGAERAIALACELLPQQAEVERVPCSTAENGHDLLATIKGDGQRRLLLLGHLDTVVAHSAHRLLTVDGDGDGDVMTGSGTVDMKGGDLIALAVMRTLAQRPELFAELAILLVVDEEWRTAEFIHAARFEGFDICLCFEAGEQTPDGREAVVVRRKAAATAEIVAHGRSAHSGAEPDRGLNALLALADLAQRLAAHHDPNGRQRMTVVPTLMRAGEGLNVVPARAELTCDLRADDGAAFDMVFAAVPAQIDGVRFDLRRGRFWPGLDARVVAAPLLKAAGELLGAEIVAAERGGASDASHIATVVPLTIDGLGPCGGGSHAADEHVLRSSITPRTRVALAIALTALTALTV